VPVEHQLPITQADDPVGVGGRQIQEVEVDDRRDAQLTVDLLG